MNYLKNVLKELEKEFDKQDNMSFNIGYFQNIVNKVKDNELQLVFKIKEDDISHLNFLEINLFKNNKSIFKNEECFYWEEDFDILTEMINQIKFADKILNKNKNRRKI